ncbi:MAG TPA: hypothetical protein VJO12_02390 [Stellaceae bacterium]|nr:hypothetical protein [Stellaceae bacterium]
MALLGLGVECVRYLMLGAYLDHIESTVVINGWQYVHGAALYEIEDGAPRFSTFYGPLAYLAPVPGLLLFGPSVAASKVAAALGLAATLAVMARHFARGAPAPAAAPMLLLAAGLLLFGKVSFWARSDSLLVLVAAVAVALAQRRHGALWVGLCIGLAVNLKAHAFLYFLPLLFELWRRDGWRAVPMVAVSSIAVFLLPFLLPGLSLPDYVAGLVQQMGHRSHVWSIALGPMLIAALLALPLMLAWPGGPDRRPRQDRAFATAAAATLVVLLYPASFTGAGAYHLLPILPALTEAFRRLQPENVAARLAPLAILLCAMPQAVATVQTMGQHQGEAAMAEEALALARQSPTSAIHMGYGDNQRSYMVSQLGKAVLALHGFPALIDAQVLGELDYVGVDGSRRWVPYLRDCRIERWLVPKGERPFALAGYYNDHPLFDEDFRRTFTDNYRLVDSSKNFDIWQCRAPKPKL